MPSWPEPITDHGLYWRVANTTESPVRFIPWPAGAPHDLLAQDQVPIFKAYKANPHKHSLPPNYDADMVWSQTVLRRLVAGESVPKFQTIITNGGLFGDAPAVQYVAPPVLAPQEALAKVKIEKTERIWRNLKRQGRVTIELSPSPSPLKKKRLTLPSAPENPDLEDHFPQVGEAPDEYMDYETGEGSGEDKQGGASHTAGFQQVCGVLVLQFLGLPVLCTADGPFSVAQLNTLLHCFGVKLNVCSKKFAAMDGKYLRHQVNHFTGIYCQEGRIQYFDQGITQELSLSQLSQLVLPEDVTLFRLQPLSCHQHQGPQLRACLGGAQPLTSPLQTCARRGCQGTLLEKGTVVHATCFGLMGPYLIEWKPKQCSSRACRTVYGYNYMWEDGKKVNVVSNDDLVDGVLFVTSKCAFRLDYLKYHEQLMFRGHLSTRAIAHAYSSVFQMDAMSLDRFRTAHENAVFYDMAIRELEKVGMHKGIVIGNELTDEAVAIFSSLCSCSLFPPTNRLAVTALVADGHSKVRVKGAGAPAKRTGRPRKEPRSKDKHGNGWLAVCDPQTGRVLHMSPMHEPENNEAVISALEAIVWLYPKCSTLVYDRACYLQPAASQREDLAQIKAFIIDSFHAYRHRKHCPCNPRNLSANHDACQLHVTLFPS